MSISRCNLNSLCVGREFLDPLKLYRARHVHRLPEYVNGLI